MLEITRISRFKPRYEVRDRQGGASRWLGRRFREGLEAEIDGRRVELRREGRRRFVLAADDEVLARAERSGRRWTVSAEASTYELGRRKAWRSGMELRQGGEVVGRIERVRAPRRTVACELPEELPAHVRAFIGFVVIAIWNREAASSGGAAGAIAAGSH
jgi:hypothetical protein